VGVGAVLVLAGALVELPGPVELVELVELVGLDEVDELVEAAADVPVEPVVEAAPDVAATSVVGAGATASGLPEPVLHAASSTTPRTTALHRPMITGRDGTASRCAGAVGAGTFRGDVEWIPSRAIADTSRSHLGPPDDDLARG
jgi:hypothetical protein